MSTRGRKPKPTNLKLLQGNPGKRAINSSEPAADVLSKAPAAPEWMPALAQQIWQGAATWLVGSKILSETDLHNLESFCMAYARWREAEQHVTENGEVLENPTSGVLYKNPSLTIINEAKKQMMTFGSALGLDPASRARLAVPGGDSKQNPFADLLGNKRAGGKR